MTTLITSVTQVREILSGMDDNSRIAVRRRLEYVDTAPWVKHCSEAKISRFKIFMIKKDNIRLSEEQFCFNELNGPGGNDPAYWGWERFELL